MTATEITDSTLGFLCRPFGTQRLCFSYPGLRALSRTSTWAMLFQPFGPDKKANSSLGPKGRK